MVFLRKYELFNNQRKLCVNDIRPKLKLTVPTCYLLFFLYNSLSQRLPISNSRPTKKKKKSRKAGDYATA